VRKYTVRYLNRGAVLKSVTASYGSTVLYDGDMPVYTGEETAYKYYLFSGWDKGGYVTGDKDINAVYDSCEYVSGYFDGKEFGSLRPVEIYAMTKVGAESTVVTSKDPMTITMGADFSFDDITEKVLIAQPTEFTGKNHVDTGVNLLSEDRSFTLAVDFRMMGTTANNGVLMQCYDGDGMNGFRLWKNSGCKLAWGTESTDAAMPGTREIIVLRHIKGENGLHVYTSNMGADTSKYTELSRTRTTKTNAELVFGCAKAADGAYESYGIGTVYWAKLWYADLGVTTCKELVNWVHSELTFNACFNRYYLSDGTGKRSSLSLLAEKTLGKTMSMDNANNNTGGWAKPTTLNTYLNSRVYKALPIGWRQLVKKVKVPGNVGNAKTDVSTADCYIFIPSAIELDANMSSEPYVYEGTAIDFITTNTSRKRTNPDGEVVSYWTRSPNKDYNAYYNAVNTSGEIYGYYYPTDTNDILLMFSI